MIKEFLSVILILFIFSFFLKLAFNLDKLIFLLKIYFSSLKELKIEFSSSTVSNKKYLHKKLDKLSLNGIKLLIYLLKLLAPYFLFTIYLLNTEYFSSDLIAISLPVTPYIILIKRKNE